MELTIAWYIYSFKNILKMIMAMIYQTDSQTPNELKIELCLEKYKVIQLYSFMSDNSLPRNFLKEFCWFCVKIIDL